MILQDNIKKFIAGFSQIPEVEGMLLAGSRTSGTADSGSDYDLYIYSNTQIPIDKRRSAILPFASYAEINNTFWETEDDWVMVDGTPVELIYRSWDWIENELIRVVEEHQSSVGYSTCLWYNVLCSEILYDPTGKAAEIKNRFSKAYPESLKRNIIGKNWPFLGLAMPSYKHQIEKPFSGNDLISVQHRTAAFLSSWFDIVLALNEQPHPGEKRLVAYLKKTCQKLPQDWEYVLNQVLQFSAGLNSQLLIALDTLTNNVRELLEQEELI